MADGEGGMEEEKREEVKKPKTRKTKKHDADGEEKKDTNDEEAGGGRGGGGGALSGGQLEVEGGPGVGYIVFATMEDLLDKLKLLHYEKDFLRNKQLGLKPITRHYFAVATNSGEQFYAFTSIAAWLIRLCGKRMDQPQEYDDPNSTIATILQAVREMNHQVDFAPNKLKTGSGEYVIYVLDKLADDALKATRFEWEKPLVSQEEQEDDAIQDNEAEITAQKADEEMHDLGGIEDDMDDDDNFMTMDQLASKGRVDEVEMTRPEEILQSNTDSAEWKLEVERVLPHLKVQIRTDNKDWRVHFEQMQQHSQGIEQTLTDTKQYLEKLHSEITRTLEKLNSREKYINNQLDHYLQEFRGLQDRLAQTRERYKEASGGVTERSRLLAEISDELDKVKQEMDERGQNMTDAAPLVRIKQALTKLRQECVQMDVRMGVLEQILLQGKMKDKTALARDLHADTRPSMYMSFSSDRPMFNF